MSELSLLPAEVAKKIGPFLKRAKEMEATDPVISYFCKFYAAEMILKEKLHSKYPEVTPFAVQLLDDIENEKKEFQESSPQLYDLISDNDASLEHVKQFGVFIFNKAFLDVKNQRTTKATVDKFLASVNFLTILKSLQDPLPEEIEMKIKYAKFHATRILKAYKAGDDPNDYITPEDESDDKELEKELEQMTFNNPPSQMNPQENEPNPETEDANDSLPSPSMPIIEDRIAPDDTPSTTPSFPVPPTELSKNPIIPSESFHSITDDSLPVVPTQLNDGLGLPVPPTYIKGDEKDPLPSVPKTYEVPHFKPPESPKLPPQPTYRRTSSVGQRQPNKQTNKKPDIKKMLSDDEIISEAQKRAKFAISALNYEDITTAIKELETALRLLKGE